ASYAVVFDGSSNSPNFALRDLRGDGTPEVVKGWSPYCGSYAASPRLITIYEWRKGQFVAATGSYPAQVEQAAETFRAALGRPQYYDAEGMACLHAALGYLAELV